MNAGVPFTEFEISPYYLSGIMDSIGSICITQGGSLQIQLTCSQCVVSVLQVIQSIFGGSIHSPKDNQHSLRLCGRDCKKMLQYLDIGCIMKWSQVQVAKQFLYDLDETKTALREEMRALNKSYKTTHNKPYNKINYEYIAGLADAEGCIHLGYKNNKPVFKYFKITQKNDYQLLDHIQQFVGHGSTADKISWVVNRVDFAVYDIQQILPFLIVKKRQAELFLKFVEATEPRRKQELFHQIKEDTRTVV